MDQTSELVLINIRKIIRAVELHSRRIYADITLTGPQLIILKAVSKNHGITISELANCSSLSQPTVSALVKKLLEKNLLLKKADKVDKRKVLLHISAKGEKLLLKSPSLLQDEFVNELNSLPSWHRYMILSSLEKLADMMHAQTVKVEPVLTPEIELM